MTDFETESYLESFEYAVYKSDLFMFCYNSVFTSLAEVKHRDSVLMTHSCCPCRVAIFPSAKEQLGCRQISIEARRCKLEESQSLWYVD